MRKKRNIFLLLIVILLTVSPAMAWNPVSGGAGGGGSSFDPTSPGPIGGSTPNTGVFTTLTAGSFISNATDGNRRQAASNTGDPNYGSPTAGDIAYNAATGNWRIYNGSGWVAMSVMPESVIAGGTCSTSYAVDMKSGTMFTLTLNGACALSVSNVAAGKSFIIKMTQSSTTAPTFTGFTWPAGTAPTWSTSATKYDVISCASFDGSTLQCNGMVDVR